MTVALEGIKILDLGYYLPAAYCTQILGDMGAEVTKIEEPIGTSSRRGGSGVSAAPGERAEEIAAHDFCNRNKKSIIVNLKHQEGVKIFHKLAENSDIIVENFRPGVVERLGIDYQTISKINPRVIFCSLSGYGQDSPYKYVAGHDPNYCSIAGAQILNRDRENRPVNFGVPLADIGTALHATIGILLSLIARDRTDKGQFVDISMTDSVFSFMSRALRDWLYPSIRPRGGKRLVDVAFGPQEVKGGKYITTANMEPYFWERFCKAIGREDFVPHQFAEGRKEEEVCSAIRQILLTKSREEWVQILTKADTTVAPVLAIDEVITDPHVLHRQLVMEINHPTLGKVKQIGFPIKLSDTPGQFRSFAPFAGKHTDEVLRELGYTNDQITFLKRREVVQ